MILRKAIAMTALLLTLPNELSARVWTTVTGQTFEAEFVRVEGANGIFIVKEKEYPYPLNRLSVADRLLIGKTLNQQSSPVATPPPPVSLTTPAPVKKPVAVEIQLAGQALKPGDSVEIDIPITDPAGLLEVKKTYGKPSEKARLLIAVPNDFDPVQKSYPLLIVSATADGAASSIGTAHQYVEDAVGKGFVLVAVDGEFGKPSHDDSTDFRWALVSASLDALNKEWPKSKNWPVATGGVSGGGGYASHQGLKLAQKRADLIGIFLSVSAWNPTSFRDELKRTPASALHNAPIFMSAGDEDKIATKERTDESHDAIMKEGFKRVRYEHFAGGHQLNHPHLQAALDWFLEQHNKSGATRSATPFRGH